MKKFFIAFYVLLIFLFLMRSSVFVVLGQGLPPSINSNFYTYYRFDNVSLYGENLTNVYDYSGRGNNGTANNTIYFPGVDLLGGQSLYFDGNTTSVKLFNQTYLPRNGTINFWVNTSYTGVSRVLFSSDMFTRFTLWYNSARSLYADLGNPNSPLYTSTILYSGPRYMVTFVYQDINSTTGNASFYLNGVYLNSSRYTGLSTNPSKIFIGMSNSGGNYYFGYLDEFLITNETWNSSKIFDVYTNYIDCQENNLSNGCTITQSTTLARGTYFLNSSSNSGGIVINNDNLVLDGNGSTIYYGNGTSLASAIYCYNHFNVSVKNFNLYDLSVLGNQQRGVFYNICYNSSASFNNISIQSTTSNYAIYSYSTNNNSFFNNNISMGNFSYSLNYTPADYGTTNGVLQYGIFTQYDFFTNVYNNSFYMRNLSLANGVYFAKSMFSNVFNNYFWADSSFGESNGIKFAHETNISNIFNNTIVTYNGNLSVGIFLEHGAHHDNISDNNITTYGWHSYGILLDTQIGNIIIRNNNISTSGDFANGIYTTTTGVNYDKTLNLDMDNNTFIYNRIRVYSNYSFTYPGEGMFETCGIYLHNQNLTNTNVSFNNITSNNVGVFYYRSSYNSVVKNIINSLFSPIYVRAISRINNVSSNWFNYYFYYVDSNSSMNIDLSNALIHFSNNSAILCSGNCFVNALNGSFVNVYDNFSVRLYKNWSNLFAFDSVSSKIILLGSSGYFNNSDLFNLSNNRSILINNFNCSERQQLLNGFPCGVENSPVSFILQSNNNSKVLVNSLNDSISNLFVSFLVDDCSRNYSFIFNPVNSNQIFYNVSNYSCNNSEVSIYLTLLPTFNDTSHNYVCTRLSNTSLIVGDTLVNGSTLNPYHFNYESGCNGYTGEYCSTQLLPGYNLTVIAENFSFYPPIWAQSNKTCLFRFYNYSSKEFNLLQAWRVASFGGQFCNVQNQWDWFIYSPGFISETMNLTPLFVNNASYKEFICGYQNRILYNNLSVYVEVPPVPPVVPSGAVLNLDFRNPFYLVLLVIFFLVWCLCMYYGLYKVASLIEITFGFIFLFSGVLWILSMIVLIGGLAILFIPNSFSFRKK